MSAIRFLLPIELWTMRVEVAPQEAANRLLQLNGTIIETPGVIWSKQCAIAVREDGGSVRLEMRATRGVRGALLPRVLVVLTPGDPGAIATARASALAASAAQAILLFGLFFLFPGRGSPWPLVAFAVLLHLHQVNRMFRPALRALRGRLTDILARANPDQLARDRR